MKQYIQGKYKAFSCSMYIVDVKWGEHAVLNSNPGSKPLGVSIHSHTCHYIQLSLGSLSLSIDILLSQ